MCFWSSHSCFLSGISPYLLLLYLLYLLVAQTTTSYQESSLLCFWQRCLCDIIGGSAETHPLGSAEPVFWDWKVWENGLGSAVPDVRFWKSLKPWNVFWRHFSSSNQPFFLQKMLLPPRFTLDSTRPKCPLPKITPCRRTRRHIYIYWLLQQKCLHALIPLLKFSFGCMTVTDSSNNCFWNYFWQCSACVWRRPSENNGIAALQLYSRIGWGIYFYITLFLHWKCFPNLKCKI